MERDTVVNRLFPEIDQVEPLAENEGVDLTGQKCFYSGEPATHVALFARAF